MENNTSFSTPIVLIIFNRPSTTARVFEAIRKIKPTKLYIAADGARKNKEGEEVLCEATRKVTEVIDWPCEVHRKYSENNLGCKRGPSSAINWFFEHEEEGIILEDDCLPSQSFFTFASMMLERYRNTQEIMHISGSNFQGGIQRGDASYYFSRIPISWGWATWRRAWKNFDIDMIDLEQYSTSKKLHQLFRDRRIVAFFVNLFRHIQRKNIDAWDAQWVYSFLKAEGIAITPNVNLIENIGFNDEATHTKTASLCTQQKAGDMLEITHPRSIVIDEEADVFLFEALFYQSFFQKVITKIKAFIRQ